MKTFKQFLEEMVPHNVNVASDSDATVLSTAILRYLNSETEKSAGTRLQQINKAKSQLNTFRTTLGKLVGVE